MINGMLCLIVRLLWARAYGMADPRIGLHYLFHGNYPTKRRAIEWTFPPRADTAGNQHLHLTEISNHPIGVIIKLDQSTHHHGS